jgi:hypothetical protein
MYLIVSDTIGPQIPFLMYLAAGILILVVNVIFIIRVYTYLSTRRAIYRTSALMGEEVEGSILNDVINVIMAGKLVIIANIVYQGIEVFQNYRTPSALLTYGSFFFSLYVIWDEYSSN